MPPGVYPRRSWMKSNSGGTLIPPRTRREMAERVKQGFSLRRVAQEFKCSRSTVASAVDEASAAAHDKAEI